jgi:hypothetical protein
MPGVEGADAGLEFLAVAAGMHDIANVVVTEDGQLRHLITDPVVGFPQCLRTQEVVGHRGKRVCTDVGDLRHTGNPHVGSPGDNTGNQSGYIGGLTGVTPQNMGEGIHTLALPEGKVQNAVNIRGRQLVKEGMVGGFAVAGVIQCPTRLPFKGEVLVFS